MSDPVTNVEIEDVLSSIRRLVSVDSARKGQAARPDVPVGQAVPDKLVLTEDLRIAPDRPAGAGARSADPASDYTQTLERRIAELEAAVTARASEFEPDGSEDTSQHRPTAMLFPAQRVPDAHDGAVDLDALVEDDLPGQPAEVEAETAEGETPGAPAPLGEVQQEAPVEHGAMWSDDGDVSGQAALEHEEPRIFARAGHADAPRRDEAADFAFPTEDALIDEETLRDMVAEIVRDELQGALGERITRNVRKLVRREIMRAISIRDFE